MDEIIITISENIGKFLFKKQMGKRTGMSQGIDGYAEGVLGKEILAIVKKHANVVSGAALANGVPGGAAVSVTAVIASTWKMYYDINKKLGISFSENFLKSVASGVVSNLASNGVAAGATNLLSFIPGIGTIGAMLGGMAINRTSIYTAGVTYLKILCSIAESGGSFDEASVNARLSSSEKKQSIAAVGNTGFEQEVLSYVRNGYVRYGDVTYLARKYKMSEEEGLRIARTLTKIRN